MKETSTAIHCLEIFMDISHILGKAGENLVGTDGRTLEMFSYGLMVQKL